MKTENLIKFLPLGGIFLILSSAINLYIYYSYFQIRITDYLELNEYVTLFMDDIIFYCWSLGGYILIELVNLIYKKARGVKEFTTQFDDYPKFRRIMTLILVIAIGALLFLAFYVDVADGRIPSIIVLILIFTVILPILLNVSGLRYNGIYYIIPLAFFLSVFNGYFNALVTLEFGNKYCYEFTMENNKFSTNYDIIYLGKSNKFIFLHNRTLNSSKVMRMGDVLEIEITE